MDVHNIVIATAKRDKSLLIKYLKLSSYDTSKMDLTELNKIAFEKLYRGSDQLTTTHLSIAVQNDNTELVKFLLKKVRYDDWRAENDQSESDLIFAIKYCSKEVVQFLLNNGASIDAHDDKNDIALILAARYGNIEVVEFFIEMGANIEAKDDKNNTALMIAVQYGYVEVVKLLLDKGANIDVKNDEGDTALILAVKFYEAAEFSLVDLVKLLLDKGADFLNHDTGVNVLEIMCQNGSWKNKLGSMLIFLGHKELLNLEKKDISIILKNNIDDIIKYCFLHKYHNTFGVLKNVLEVFSNNDQQEFCQKFLAKVQESCDESLSRFQRYNNGNENVKLNYYPVNVDYALEVQFRDDKKMPGEIYRLAQILFLLKDYKKMFFSINANSNEQNLVELEKIFNATYKEIEKPYNEFNDNILDLTNIVIQSTYWLGKISNSPAIYYLLSFLYPSEISALFVSCGRNPDEISLDGFDFMEDSSDGSDFMEDSSDGFDLMEDSSGLLLCDEIYQSDVPALGSGGAEEAKGQS